MPGTKKPVFSLTTPFVPRGGRENLSAFAVVNSDPGPDYGKISVLQLPRNTNIAGPSQVASNFEAKPEVANSLSLLRRGGSDVVLGMCSLFMSERLQTQLHIHCFRRFSYPSEIKLVMTTH
jgi:uncharacterized membrane protein (UPF0182 family)